MWFSFVSQIWLDRNVSRKFQFSNLFILKETLFHLIEWVKHIYSIIFCFKSQIDKRIWCQKHQQKLEKFIIYFNRKLTMSLPSAILIRQKFLKSLSLKTKQQSIKMYFSDFTKNRLNSTWCLFSWKSNIIKDSVGRFLFRNIYRNTQIEWSFGFFFSSERFKFFENIFK